MNDELKDSNLTRQRRTARGKCVVCGKNRPWRKGRSCRDCLQEKSKETLELREDRKGEGLCRCGKPVLFPLARCFECAFGGDELTRTELEHFRELVDAPDGFVDL